MYEKDTTVKDRFQRLNDEFITLGQRQSFEAVLLVHDHGHPHILLLQLANNFFKLPGGEIEKGETFLDGINRSLNDYLSSKDSQIIWKITDVLARWHRSNAEPPQYPYKVPHVAQHKEEKFIVLMHMPEEMKFVVPRNYKLVAAPFFEIYNNSDNYGNVISSIPGLVSRYECTAVPAKHQSSAKGQWFVLEYQRLFWT